jgi:tRNA pseudouridine38-40 synthase
MRIALKFAYDGQKFNGYARQPEFKTVEGEIIKSLVKNGIIEDTKESVFRSASRTDKAVSALCNVIAFNTDVSKKQILKELLNEITTILFYGIQDVEEEFNPRYAKMRHYRYYLESKNLDIEKIISAASSFTGTRNFSNFAKLEQFKNPVRTIDNILFTKEKDFLIIDFYAQTFLWHQIRRIISALEKVGGKKLDKEQIIAALVNPDKTVDYGLAPAEPLILKNIDYDFDFEYNKSALDKLKDMEDKISMSILKQK